MILTKERKGFLPTVRRARENVDEPSLINHNHMIHVSMLAMSERSPLLFANEQTDIFKKNLEKLKVAVKTWYAKGADTSDSRNNNPL